MQQLKKYRDEIDSIDEEIVKLLEKRLEICFKVGEYKKDNNLDILNASREQEVLEKNLSRILDSRYKLYISEILQTVMNESKKLQSEL